MGRPDTIIERRRRKQARIANAPAVSEAELNAYNPKRLDWNIKEGALCGLAAAATPKEFDGALTRLAFSLTQSPRISNAQAGMFMMGLYEAPRREPLVTRGEVRDRVSHRINTNSALQISTLVNTFQLRESESPKTRADLAVSIFNRAHMAVGALNSIEVDFKEGSYPDKFLKKHLGAVVSQRQHLVHELVGQRIISPDEAAALLDAQDVEGFEKSSASVDYLLVRPFQRGVESASRLVTAFKRAQELLYLGFSMGMRDLDKAYWSYLD